MKNSKINVIYRIFLGISFALTGAHLHAMELPEWSPSDQYDLQLNYDGFGDYNITSLYPFSHFSTFLDKSISLIPTDSDQNHIKQDFLRRFVHLKMNPQKKN